jgi:hypothetical protein
VCGLSSIFPSTFFATFFGADMFSFSRPSLLILASLPLASLSCDGEQRTRDASAPPTSQTAEVSVRFDVSPQKAPTVSVLAFRATASGISRREVLGIVDPLAAAGPERDCELRDVDVSASALVAQGGSIELQELGGVGIGLGSSESILRPFPRLYPDVATVVGGVVGEAGPLQVNALPERISLFTADSELPLEELAVPSAPRILTVNGAALSAGAKITVTDGLSISVSGGPGTIVEVRPFGATVAVACSVSQAAAPESTLVVPRALLTHLMGGSAAPGGASSAATAIPVSLEVLKRNRLRLSPLTSSGRLSLEVRSATAVELRP